MGLMVAAGGIALAHKMLKRSIWPEARRMSYEPMDQIIEIYDYEIVNENQNQGHKTSSSRMGISIAYRIAIRLLNLLRSILPPCSERSQRMRSRGSCERLVIS
jgi:hypothetical protein